MLPNVLTLIGPLGPSGNSATITVAETSTLPPGSNATVVNVGTSSAAVLQFGIPEGEPGSNGTTPDFTIGTVVTGAPGSEAEATITGSQANPVLNLTIPAGSNGAVPTVSLGTVTAVSSVSNPAITNSGTASAAVFNFSIPKPIYSTLENIFIFGDSYSDNGNSNYLNGGSPPYTWFSNGPTWAALLCESLGLPNVARWTPEGSTPGALGNNYAVGGAGISTYNTPGEGGTGDTKVGTQISMFLNDYGNVVPANSVIFIEIGTNDFSTFMPTGLVSDQFATTGWTMPALNANVTITVSGTTTDLLAGMYIITDTGFEMPIATVNSPTSLTITNTLGYAEGTVVAAAPMEQANYFIFKGDMALFGNSINSLVAAGPTTQIFLHSVGGGTLAAYSNQGSTIEATANATATIFNAGLQALTPTSVKTITFWDWMSAIWYPVITNPTQYAFKTSTVGWANNTAENPDDFVYWDAPTAHPSGAFHRRIAEAAREMLRVRNLISPL
jgi:phospholipase/lecithinase/hemolysin